MVPPVKSGSLTPTTTQEEQAIASSRGMKRPLPQDDAVAARPPPKKAAVKSIAKKASTSVITPPTAGKAGLSAKTTAAAPAESFTKGSAPALSGSPVPKPTGQMRKAAPGAMEKKMAASPSPPSQANGPAAKADGAEPPSKVVASIRELLLAMKASPAGNKLRDAATLGNALAHNLPIDHIAVFLRSLKKKLAERGQREGVRVPVIPSRPTAATEESSLTAQTTTQVSASAATPSSPAPPPPQKQNQQQPQQPKQPQEPQQPHQPQQRPPAKAISKSSPATDSVGTPPTPSPSSAPLARQVAKSKPASIPAKSAKEAQSMPPPSPPADSQSAEALIALVGEFTENPVCEDGEIKDGRLDEVLRRLWDGVARKPKDWMAAWQAMVIPVEKQGEALQKLLNIAFVRAEEPDKAPAVIAELVKNHKVKMRSVEEVLVTFGSNLDGILTVNEDAWKIYSEFLYRVFPKPAGSGWGWSRVGWSWSSWWQFTEKCVQSIESAKAFDIIALMLRLIQDREGSTLAELPMWTDGDKLQRTLTKLCELGSCSAVEVIDRLAILGVVVDSS